MAVAEMIAEMIDGRETVPSSLFMSRGHCFLGCLVEESLVTTRGRLACVGATENRLLAKKAYVF